MGINIFYYSITNIMIPDIDYNIEYYYEIFKTWKDASVSYSVQYDKIRRNMDELETLKIKLLNEPTTVEDFVKYFNLARLIKQDLVILNKINEKEIETRELLQEVEKNIIPQSVSNNSYLVDYDKKCSLI